MQTATLADAIVRQVAQQGFTITFDAGVYRIERVVAERRAFLSTRKLTYEARWRVDDLARRVRFSEMLREAGMGLSSGSIDGMSPGFGFRKETWSAGMQGRSGGIEEQSSLFGKRYAYTFDYALVRRAVEQLAAQAGYTFDYHVLPVSV